MGAQFFRFQGPRNFPPEKTLISTSKCQDPMRRPRRTATSRSGEVRRHGCCEEPARAGPPKKRCAHGEHGLWMILLEVRFLGLPFYHTYFNSCFCHMMVAWYFHQSEQQKAGGWWSTAELRNEKGTAQQLDQMDTCHGSWAYPPRFGSSKLWNRSVCQLWTFFWTVNYSRFVGVFFGGVCVMSVMYTFGLSLSPIAMMCLSTAMALRLNMPITETSQSRRGHCDAVIFLVH